MGWNIDWIRGLEDGLQIGEKWGEKKYQSQSEKLENKTKYLWHDQFYFELLETFPIVKNNCLQHYVPAFSKKYLLDNYKSSKV